MPFSGTKDDGNAVARQSVEPNSTSASQDMAIGSERYYKSLELDASEIWESKSSPPRVVLNLSFVLERSIGKNEKLQRSTKKNDGVTNFHGVTAPNLSVREYLERIFKYCRCSASCFVMAQIYMDRFFGQRGGYLTSLNVHRLLITTLMLAAKFLDDECYSNAYYAKVGGISTSEMNEMELEFLFSVGFKLCVTTEVFDKYCEQLDREVVQEHHIHRSMNRRKSEKWRMRWLYL